MIRMDKSTGQKGLNSFYLISYRLKKWILEFDCGQKGLNSFYLTSYRL